MLVFTDDVAVSGELSDV